MMPSQSAGLAHGIAGDKIEANVSSLNFLPQLKDGQRFAYKLGYITPGSILHQDLVDWGGRSLFEGGNVGELSFAYKMQDRISASQGNEACSIEYGILTVKTASVLALKPRSSNHFS